MDFLYDSFGQRKYVTSAERRAFLNAARQIDPSVYTFCATLAYTGARISEVLALVVERVDPETGVIIIESLKKRRRGVYRAVPVPASLLERLDSVHDLYAKRGNSNTSRQRFWPWCRTTGWKHVKNAMTTAEILGKHATPKGLRHSFGVTAIQKGIPITLVQKWLGHSRLSTTAIYSEIVGDEEREIASQMWKSFGAP